MKHTNHIKRIVITTGALLMLFSSPIIQNNPLGEYLNSMTTITAMAAEQPTQLPYSTRWETQADNSWRYKLDNGTYATGWIQDEVDKNWYYMDSTSTMQSGVYMSYNKYYLLSELHDGHYGHLVKNGETYQGIVISASTNPADEGALSSESLAALRNAGINVDNVKDISGSQHVTDGKVTTPESNTESSNSSGSGGLTAEEKPFDINFNGVLDADERAMYEGLKSVNWDDYNPGKAYPKDAWNF